MDASSPTRTDESSLGYEGWRIVAVCFLLATFGWGLGFYGQSVYVAELHKQHGWPASLVSSGTTFFYLFGAALVAFVSEAIKAALPEQARTLHRLLGSRGDRPQVRHTAANPLALDVLVVDEASMVDLAMMAKLLDALPATGRLILLGDKDQLCAVEAGAVFAELCDGRGFNASAAADLQRLTGQSVPDVVPRDRLRTGDGMNRARQAFQSLA